MDPKQAVTAPLLLDTIEELRDAGAEAIQINDIRVVANTYFSDVSGGVAVSGTPLSTPYTITAIGDSQTLASAMDIPGGVNESVRNVGGDTVVTTESDVHVTALQTVSAPEYARPVPTPSTS